LIQKQRLKGMVTLTLIQKQRLKGMVTMMRILEMMTSMKAQGPGPSGSAVIIK
jgi:hypothetical protein